ncbi:MAG: cytochrome C [Betaproteobacteria bacterium CG2_30_59_46]|nr:MAG: cytochrome C [Betaproteobacteria bacterium CG2_30_59_46]PIQ13966.1 MAG: cytochrome C [Hydrogenophilales bacterium CG18_big_fil_WC_8_21_14_2_50_58_12]PIY01033.1 MAG: cytochrome C [Hydrogenophilales bacterium CG_4_10_14_3_um_filter_58_23]PJB04746.1 MAG: cytochrome C [Hydrogenophilales bacterium CG_4_9_14_3_um_filter_59_35]
MKLLPVIAAAVSAALICSSAFAVDGAKLFAEKTCTACHGKDGKTPLLPDYPKIAGQNKAYIEKQMHDIKSGARANGNAAAMKGVMVIVSEADIKVLAEYVSKLKP